MTSRTVVAVGHAYLVSFFQTFLKGQTALSSNGTHVYISKTLVPECVNNEQAFYTIRSIS